MILRQYASARAGITLLEVLTAIFIMGVGLLAILTLFPLGALSMARAVRDDRAAAIGANAASLAIAMDLRNDFNLVGNPMTPGPLLTTPTGVLVTHDGPGYPVLVDPVYRSLLGSTNLGGAGGTTATPGITRVSPSYVQPPLVPAAQTARAIARWFTFQDEITFEKTGQPVGSTLPPPQAINRPGTYSWAYLLRRPRPLTANVVELSVIVYASRAVDTPQGETTINTGTMLGAKGTNVVAISFSGEKPNIRKGGWILDTSARAVTGGTTVNGYFYRVASVTDTGANSMTLELESSLRENVTTLVLMENVITVLDRGTNWRP